MLKRSKRALGALLGTLALVVGISAQASTGAAVSPHAMAPSVALGPMADASNVTATSPQGNASYLLRVCQVQNYPGVLGNCYDPYQMRKAYGFDKLIGAGYDGRGSTIVIVDAYQSPNLVQQVNLQDAYYGLPGLNGLGNPSNPGLGTFTQIAPDGLTAFVPGDPNMTGWAEEISLDVMWAHAMAPGANIVLDLAKTNDDADILSATKYAVDNRLGDVISQSFGENESCVDPTIAAAQHQVFAQATAKHMTLFASSGDNGAGQPTCDGSALTQAVSSPAVDPLVTAVGGTELHAANFCFTAFGCDPTTYPAPGTYQGEIAWNESAYGIGGTGGGYSVVYSEPPYQKSTVHDGNVRAVPDVAFNAAVFHGVLTYLNIPGIPAGFYRFGGTSAGSPQWAALTAIADQKAGHPLGFLNKALYDLGKRPDYNDLFHDVTSGTNAMFGVAGFNAGPGWDATTGLGSPRADTLVDALINSVSPGDTQSAISTTKYPTQSKGHVGHVSPH